MLNSGQEDIATDGVDSDVATVDASALCRRDPRLEATLEEMAIQPEYITGLQADDVDYEASLNNQARWKALDRDTVDRYKTTLRSGQPLPAILGRLNKKQKIVIISGNHRYTAYQELGLPYNCYIISAPDHIIQELMATENLYHGLPSSYEERLRQALNLVDRGMSKADAARKMLVRYADLDKAAKDVESRRRAVEAGIRLQDWEKIHPATRSRLHSVHTNEGLKALADLILKADIPHGTVVQIIPQINVTRSGERQAELVNQLYEVYAQSIRSGGKAYRATGGKKNTPRIQAERIMTSLRNLNVAALGQYYDEPDREAAIERVDQTMAALKAIKAELRRAPR